MEFIQFTDGRFAVSDLVDGNSANDSDTGVDALAAYSVPASYTRGSTATLNASLTAQATAAVGREQRPSGGGSTGAGGSSGGSGGGGWRWSAPVLSECLEPGGRDAGHDHDRCGAVDDGESSGVSGCDDEPAVSDHVKSQYVSSTLQASRSQMLDANMATEIAALTRQQVIKQAGQRMIAISQMSSTGPAVAPWLAKHRGWLGGLTTLLFAGHCWSVTPVEDPQEQLAAPTLVQECGLSPDRVFGAVSSGCTRGPDSQVLSGTRRV